jgi:hypothetical protein
MNVAKRKRGAEAAAHGKGKGGSGGGDAAATETVAEKEAAAAVEVAAQVGGQVGGRGVDKVDGQDELPRVDDEDDETTVPNPQQPLVVRRFADKDKLLAGGLIEKHGGPRSCLWEHAFKLKHPTEGGKNFVCCFPVYRDGNGGGAAAKIFGAGSATADSDGICGKLWALEPTAASAAKSSAASYSSSKIAKHFNQVHKGSGATTGQAAALAHHREVSAAAPPSSPFAIAAIGGQAQKDREHLAQARLYCYGDSPISQRLFLCPYMHAALQSGKATQYNFISREDLLDYVQSEYLNFCLMFRWAVEVSECYYAMITFMQLSHDGGTLGSGDSYLAHGATWAFPHISVEHAMNDIWRGLRGMICESFDMMNVCVGFTQNKDHTGQGQADIIKDNYTNVLGDETAFDRVTSSTISDFAALAVASKLDQQADGCKMHSGDKVGSWAIGHLTRKDGSGTGALVNPFPVGVALVAKVRDAAKYYSYASRSDELEKACELHNQSFAKPKVDLNGTRIAAKHRLLESMLRLWKPHNTIVHALASGTTGEKRSADRIRISDEEWAIAAEFEAVLAAIATATTIVQFEALYTGGMRCIVQAKLVHELQSENLAVFDFEQSMKDHKLPRGRKAVNNFSAAGKECVARANSEAQKRFGPPLAKHELAAIVFDARLKGMRFLEAEQRAAAIAAAVEYLASHLVAIGLAGGSPAAGSDDNDGGIILSDNDASSGSDDDMFSLGASNFSPSASEESPMTTETAEEVAQALVAKWLTLEVDFIVAVPDLLKYRITNKKLSITKHLFDLDLGAMYCELMKNPMLGCYKPCFVAGLALCSSNLSQSFCERVISTAALVMPDSNTLMKPHLVEMCCVLRMNRRFVEHMRSSYPDLPAKLLQEHKKRAEAAAGGGASKAAAGSQ